MRKPIRVLIVDDSAVVRQVLTQRLSADRAINVIGAAADPVFAMDRMAKEWPDVIVLDVEMPRMDGLTFLRKIMAERPTPVVICSTLTTQGAETTMQAMAAGAVSIVAKPKANLKQYLLEESDDLVAVVKAAAQARVKRMAGSPRLAPAPAKLSADAILPSHLGSPTRAMSETTDRVVALGTSTGGTQALEQVLSALPVDCPGLVIVQHMPEAFTAAFAQRLNKVCDIEVREAAHGDRVHTGLALIAPGGRHLVLERNGAQYRVAIVDGPPVSRHRPSVDVLFRSVARSAGRNALGVIMTGMGDDGARGLKEMREAGAHTLGQDEDSCVVYGMPKEARKLGGVERELPLDAIPSAIVSGR
ncbi:MAG TPA: chemotaxis response regulator protein-glutamate methylesterase [Aquabacterium sp.]|uniref:protein-glutamate methylesterase/protein-glutamine glutaminase n=1 Tax=Aquabacterium sp. TaxID=1872578 RepID=UPI002E2F781A|nr:chemotaxis response regulator protein-glutamate methylesterase [Aquabacterium sp.]HEX5355840.1 chemotaxis response regulator protein-glutamate methylesterase [Aquabacterium sp.]